MANLNINLSPTTVPIPTPENTTSTEEAPKGLSRKTLNQESAIQEKNLHGRTADQRLQSCLTLSLDIVISYFYDYIKSLNLQENQSHNYTWLFTEIRTLFKTTLSELSVQNEGQAIRLMGAMLPELKTKLTRLNINSDNPDSLWSANHQLYLVFANFTQQYTKLSNILSDLEIEAIIVKLKSMNAEPLVHISNLEIYVNFLNNLFNCDNFVKTSSQPDLFRAEFVYFILNNVNEHNNHNFGAFISTYLMFKDLGETYCSREKMTLFFANYARHISVSTLSNLSNHPFGSFIRETFLSDLLSTQPIGPRQITGLSSNIESLAREALALPTAVQTRENITKLFHFYRNNHFTNTIQRALEERADTLFNTYIREKFIASLFIPALINADQMLYLIGDISQAIEAFATLPSRFQIKKSIDYFIFYSLRNFGTSSYALLERINCVIDLFQNLLGHLQTIKIFKKLLRLLTLDDPKPDNNSVMPKAERAFYKQLSIEARKLTSAHLDFINQLNEAGYFTYVAAPRFATIFLLSEADIQLLRPHFESVTQKIGIPFIPFFQITKFLYQFSKLPSNKKIIFCNLYFKITIHAFKLNQTHLIQNTESSAHLLNNCAISYNDFDNTPSLATACSKLDEQGLETYILQKLTILDHLVEKYKSNALMIIDSLFIEKEELLSLSLTYRHHILTLFPKFGDPGSVLLRKFLDAVIKGQNFEHQIIHFPFITHCLRLILPSYFDEQSKPEINITVLDSAITIASDLSLKEHGESLLKHICESLQSNLKDNPEHFIALLGKYTS